MLDTCGSDVPLHFTAFHPDFRMQSTPPTSAETVFRARQIALACGLRHVYEGNIKHFEAQSSYCTGCGTRMIGRDWHLLSTWQLSDFGNCTICDTKFSGHFSGYHAIGAEKGVPLGFNKDFACIMRRFFGLFSFFSIIYDTPSYNGYQKISFSTYRFGLMAFQVSADGAIFLQSAFNKAIDVRGLQCHKF